MQDTEEQTYTVGPYTLVAELEPEGRWRIFQGHDPAADRDVTIKVMPGNLWQNPERKARFLREFRTAAMLQHPNIAGIHETGEFEGNVYIASEFVDGATLPQFLSEGPMTMAEIAYVGVALSEALAYAHEHGVLHRDLEAANVQLTSDGEPKLLNFGLPKVRTETLSADGIGAPILGTPSAMSPEQALGRPVDARSEVFSLGSLLYEMACAQPAFAGMTPRDTLEAVIEATPEPLEALRPDLPDDLAMIVERAMNKDPEKRYANMTQLAADLRTFQRRVDSLLGESVRRAARKLPRPLLWGGLLAALALAAWLVLGR
ncbi:MAG: serine/threonine protein kinase [Planctomycetes bacterium]|nr:serine/threonine protein kinase [Planctomycetota bacterium]